MNRGALSRTGSVNKVFFGYPSQPELLRETISNAAHLIESLADVEVTRWEDLRVGGRIIIQAVLEAIDDAHLACFEVTDLNENVLFELGYALGTGTPIWLVRDTSDEKGNRKWEQVRTLTTVGYEPYLNSEQIRAAFLKDRPDLAAHSLFDVSIRPHLRLEPLPSVFYLAGAHETEAGRVLTRRIDQERQRGLRVVTADASESGAQPLDWYAQNIYSSEVVVAHLSTHRRSEAEVHNARCALICGLAIGMGKPLLMVAEEDYLAPIDYRDLLYQYPSARACERHVDSWLRSRLETAIRDLEERAELAKAQALVSELQELRLGQHVAENEEDSLSEYFVDTDQFQRVLSDQTTVFIGRKGTGKTANLLRAADLLSKDKRNLVCVIKPHGYELEGILSLLQKFGGREGRSFLVESLWKYLIYYELARTALNDAKSKPAGIAPGSPESELENYLREDGEDPPEFSVRLERTVLDLLSLPHASGLESERLQISQALHQTSLRDLRALLGKVLKDRDRVAILVDNLDKSWDRGSDLDLLGHLLLGLLSSVNRTRDEFLKESRRRERVNVTLAVFIRSDIFARVTRIAREPDKIPQARLRWGDRSLLLRIVEERYLANQPVGTSPKQLWEKYFPEGVDGREAPAFILDTILPRPRDLLYFCNAAVSAAFNHRHVSIRADDLLDARETYSQFAFEALLVESSTAPVEIEEALYEFAGAPSIVDELTLRKLLDGAGVDSEDFQVVVDHFRTLSFLGIRTGVSKFSYTGDPGERAKADVLARRYASENAGEIQFQVHPAFHAYLEIKA